MSVVSSEHVMVVPTELFREIGYFQGFCGDTETYLKRLLDGGVTQYLPRDQMEVDPSFKQLIPYCVFRYTDEQGVISLFQYTRGSGQGESRLHSKRSIGIGGHVSTLDSDSSEPYLQGMQRELDEEVAIETKFQEQCIGLINDDENEVGKVHLGIVHVFDMELPNVSPREEDISLAGFKPLSELMEEIEQFETWSQICLQAGVLG